jgi:hypothetical protein
MMVEFDLLLYRLHGIVRDNVYCEDGELRIRNKAKYDIVNLVEEIDKEWFKQLMKELEYDE